VGDALPLAPLLIGLTGGIGSGKSTVACMLQRHGAAVIDTDAISRELTQPGGAAIGALREAFGASAIRANGGLDRDQMRQRVFADPTVRRRLESILHPLILAQTQREVARAADASVIVLDIPLLVESGQWLDRVHRVLVVDCSEATQIARVMDRSSWSADAVRSVIAAQATREQRLAVATDVIVNESISEPELATRVDALWGRWMALDRPAL
jgi:dephospho-CoA kinase